MNWSSAASAATRNTDLLYVVETRTWRGSYVATSGTGETVSKSRNLGLIAWMASQNAGQRPTNLVHIEVDELVETRIVGAGVDARSGGKHRAVDA